MGRPCKYETHVKPYLNDIKEALERGVEENKIAKELGISVSSWCEYKLKFSEFAEVFKKKDVSKILQQLDGALMKAARGYKYEETRRYIRENEDGDEVVTTEIISKEQPPNVTAIFGAYNRFDENYIKDKAYYKLRQQELKLKKAIAEANNFDLDIKE